MEDNKKSYSAEGRKLRPRKKVSFDGTENRSEGGYGHRNHDNGNRSANGGERRPYNSGERKPYGERRSSFSGNAEGDERRSYGDRPQRSFGDRKPSFGGNGGFRTAALRYPESGTFIVVLSNQSEWDRPAFLRSLEQIVL